MLLGALGTPTGPQRRLSLEVTHPLKVNYLAIEKLTYNFFLWQAGGATLWLLWLLPFSYTCLWTFFYGMEAKVRSSSTQTKLLTLSWTYFEQVLRFNCLCVCLKAGGHFRSRKQWVKIVCVSAHCVYVCVCTTWTTKYFITLFKLKKRFSLSPFNIDLKKKKNT